MGTASDFSSRRTMDAITAWPKVKRPAALSILKRTGRLPVCGSAILPTSSTTPGEHVVVRGALSM